MYQPKSIWDFPREIIPSTSSSPTTTCGSSKQQSVNHCRFLYSWRHFLRPGGLRDQAITYYSDASSRDPKTVVYCNNLGAAYSGKGRYDLAVPVLKKAVKLDPTNPHCLLNLASAYNNLKQYQNAIDIRTQLLKTDSNKRDAYKIRSTAYSALGRTEEALQDQLKADGTTSY